MLKPKPKDFTKPADCGCVRVSPALVTSEYAAGIKSIRNAKTQITPHVTVHIHILFPDHIVSSEQHSHVSWTVGMILQRSCAIANAYASLIFPDLNSNTMSIKKIHTHGDQMYVDIYVN